MHGLFKTLGTQSAEKPLCMGYVVCVLILVIAASAQCFRARINVELIAYNIL